MELLIIGLFVALFAYLLLSNSPSGIEPEDEDLNLTEDEIEILQDTWAQVVTIKTQAAEIFYASLFETAPEVKSMFTGDMEVQGDKLISTIAKVVNSIDKLDRVTPILQELAISHLEYDVLFEHYAVVGETLLWTLEQGLGEGYTEETEKAWTKAYNIIAKVMTDAAYE